MSVYLHLFHGRDALEQDLDTWGREGPTIGPLSYVHTTYGSDVKLRGAPHLPLTQPFPELVKRARASRDFTLLTRTIPYFSFLGLDLKEESGSLIVGERDQDGVDAPRRYRCTKEVLLSTLRGGVRGES